MTKLSLGRHLIAIVATLLVSTACMVGAVGPATATGQAHSVASEVSA